MNRRTLTVVALLAVLATSTPAAAAQSPDEVCADYEDATLVGVLASGETIDEETTLFPGTELDVYYCVNNRPHVYGDDSWSIAEDVGTEVDSSEDWVRVELVARSGTIPPSELLAGDGDVTGLTITIHARPTVESTLAGGEVAFPVADDAEAYENAERRFVESESAALEAAGTLEDAGETLSRGEADLEAFESADSDLRRVEDLPEARADLESQLFEAAWETGDESALAAIETARERETAANEEVDAALDSYANGLETARKAARNTVLQELAATAILGLVVGTIPGWWFTRRELEKIEYDTQFTASATFSPRLVAVPVLLAIVVLVATVAGLALLDGLDLLIGGLL